MERPANLQQVSPLAGRQLAARHQLLTDSLGEFRGLSLISLGQPGQPVEQPVQSWRCPAGHALHGHGRCAQQRGTAGHGARPGHCRPDRSESAVAMMA